MRPGGVSRASKKTAGDWLNVCRCHYRNSVGGPGLGEQGDNFPQFDKDGPGFETTEWASKQHPPHLESWANWSGSAT